MPRVRMSACLACSASAARTCCAFCCEVAFCGGGADPAALAADATEPSTEPLGVDAVADATEPAAAIGAEPAAAIGAELVSTAA